MKVKMKIAGTDTDGNTHESVVGSGAEANGVPVNIPLEKVVGDFLRYFQMKWTLKHLSIEAEVIEFAPEEEPELVMEANG